MNEEWNSREELKLYLNRVLSLRPAKNLSPLSFFIFKLGKELMDAIGEEAGYVGERKRYLTAFYELGKATLSYEESKVTKIILEGLEWVSEGNTLWRWELDEHKGGIPENLHGDEVFYAFEFAIMTDKEIEDTTDIDPIARLKSIGIDVINPRESIKPEKEQHNVVSPDFDVWQPLEKLAKEAGSDFFDYVSDETLNDISDGCDFLEEIFKDYLDSEKGLKERVRSICPDTFNEKWKLLLKVYLQVKEESDMRRVSNEAIIELLPFISDIDWESDTIMVKIPALEPKVLYLFGNLRADDFGYKNGWYYGWYD